MISIPENVGMDTLKLAVLVLGFMDAYKYKLMTQKVARLKASGQIPRKFLVWSILNRIVLLLYVWLELHDWILFTTSAIALYTMLEAFYYVYEFYPYRGRGRKNFRKPSMWVFIKDIFSKHTYGKRL